MTDPKNIAIQDYSYVLPEERIAYFPLEKREQSKLLVYKHAIFTEDIYQNINQHLPEKSLLLFNNTKVIEARLLFTKPTGGHIEIFCLEPHEQYADITTAMEQKNKVLWKCLVGGMSKWKDGQILEKKIHFQGEEIAVHARFVEKKTDSFIIELSWQPSSFCFAEILHAAGVIPLPPYIKRDAAASDTERYQTVYAKHDGSVAAPTAGLHFTTAIFDTLKTKNIHTDFVTLHVGAGTFKPVKAATMQDHEMHAEWLDVSIATIQRIYNSLGNPIIAVGTTSLRTLESLYWLGVKLATFPVDTTEKNIITPSLSQWEVYELSEKNIPADIALKTLLDWMQENKLERLITKTQIIIAPGYTFKIINGLVTNFHQPTSTLLLLVAALIGDDWKKVYAYALENNFRFLSYGDGSLLWKK